MKTLDQYIYDIKVALKPTTWYNFSPDDGVAVALGYKKEKRFLEAQTMTNLEHLEVKRCNESTAASRRIRGEKIAASYNNSIGNANILKAAGYY